MIADMDALRQAVDYLYQAIIAIDVGDNDHARWWLLKGVEPAARAFPSGTAESFGLPLVYGALIEAAA